MVFNSGYVPVNGGRLYYEVNGEGHPLVLIHAGFLDRRMWDDQFEVFGSKYKVIRYDVRGFGKSDRPKERFSDASDLYTLLRHLNIDKACVMGLSNGGRIALDFAVEYPQMVDALVLADFGVSGYGTSGADEERLWDEVASQEKAQQAAVKEK